MARRRERGPDPITRWLGDAGEPPAPGRYRGAFTDEFLAELNDVIGDGTEAYSGRYRRRYAVAAESSPSVGSCQCGICRHARRHAPEARAALADRQLEYRVTALANRWLTERGLSTTRPDCDEECCDPPFPSGDAARDIRSSDYSRCRQVQWTIARYQAHRYALRMLDLPEDWEPERVRRQRAVATAAQNATARGLRTAFDQVSASLTEVSTGFQHVTASFAAIVDARTVAQAFDVPPELLEAATRGRTRPWADVRRELAEQRASVDRWADDGGTVGLVDY